MEPRGYQLEDTMKLVSWKRSANFSEVGTGKTLVSILWAFYHLYSKRKVVVVMPPTLIPQYMGAFDIVRGHPFSLGVLAKDVNKRHNIMDTWDKEGWPDVLFMSYQMLVKYAKQLRAYKAMICDEAHIGFSNVANQAFQKAFFFVHSRDNYLLEMTATPMTTEVRSAYGHIRLRDPDRYLDLSQFDRMHVIYQNQTIEERAAKGAKIIAGYQNLDLIESNLNRMAVRRRAVDVLSLEVPNIIEHVVALEPKHSRLYYELLEARILEMGDEIIVARNQQALRQMALQIITNLDLYTDKMMDDEPLESLKVIQESLGDEKLVVFCQFQNTVKKLNRVFKHLNPALIYGGSDVPKNVTKFQTDDTCKLAVIQYQSGGAGFNLQEQCHNVVFFEASGSPGALIQALGRVHRSGQTKPVNAWVFKYMVGAGANTVSSKLLAKVFVRAEDIKKVMQDEITPFVDYYKRDKSQIS